MENKTVGEKVEVEWKTALPDLKLVFVSGAYEVELG